MPSADTVNTDTDTVYLSDINIDPVSVLNKLNRLRSDKAAGPDELSPRVLKEITEEICEPLTIILQRLIDEGSIPDDWSNANISPIYKQQYVLWNAVSVPLLQFARYCSIVQTL